MKIAFRVDSSSHFGLGHVSRCITLAKEFKLKGCKVIFICKEIDDTSKIILKNNNILLVKINKYLSNIQDGLTTNKIIKKNKINIIFLDSYVLGLSWEKIVSQECKIAWIDDYYKRESVADFYINYHSFLYGKKLNKLKKNCKKLIGLEYLILKKRPKKIFRKRQVFCYFGSVDSKSLTEKLINTLKKNNKLKFKYNIFVTKNFNSNFHLNKKKVNIITTFKKNITKHMLSSEKILIQGGVSFYEALFLGNDVTAFPINQFQKKIMRSLRFFLKFKTINNFKNLEGNIFNNKGYSRENFNKNLLDDFGKKRIVDFIIGKNKYSLRKFENKDLLSLYNLRMDYLTRKYAINQNVFNFRQHQKFFKIKQNPKTKIYIYYSNHNFVGQVRLDKLKNCFEIDYGINSIYRNKRLSYKMLKLVLDKIKNSKLKFIAKVKRNNLASIRIFEKLGFNLISKQNKIIIFEKKYGKKKSF